jgi:heme/copper-type cytochrome/quinol oxidase subunit 2
VAILKLLVSIQNYHNLFLVVKKKKSSSDDNTVAIAVGVTFGILGFLLIVLGIFCYLRYSKKKDSHEKVAADEQQAGINKTLETSNITL